MKLYTLYVNAKQEVPLGAVIVRTLLGRNEDGRTLDGGLFWYFHTTRAEAEDAAAKVRASAFGFDCTIKEDDHAHPPDGHRGVGRPG